MGRTEEDLRARVGDLPCSVLEEGDRVMLVYQNSKLWKRVELRQAPGEALRSLVILYKIYARLDEPDFQVQQVFTDEARFFVLDFGMEQKVKWREF